MRKRRMGPCVTDPRAEVFNQVDASKKRQWFPAGLSSVSMVGARSGQTGFFAITNSSEPSPASIASRVNPAR